MLIRSGGVGYYYFYFYQFGFNFAADIFLQFVNINNLSAQWTCSFDGLVPSGSCTAETRKE